MTRHIEDDPVMVFAWRAGLVVTAVLLLAAIAGVGWLVWLRP
jgi:hypothetical protein